MHMLLFHFSINGYNPEAESRMMGMSPEHTESFKRINVPTGATNAEYTAWKKANPGAQEFVDHFMDSDDISDASIREYLDAKAAGLDKKKDEQNELTPFEKNLTKNLDARIDVKLDNSERIKADANIQVLVEYLKERKKVVYESHQKLKNIMQKEDMAPALNWTTNKITDSMGTFWEGFKEASGPDKAAMLLGVVTMVIVAKFALNMAGDKSGKIKNALGIVLGGGVLYMAFQAANRTRKGPMSKALMSEKSWDASQHAEDIDTIRSGLASADIPDSLIKKISPAGKDKYVKGMANLATMDVNAFGALYNKYRVVKEIPDTEPGFPKRPCREDSKHPENNLSPLHRFNLVEDIAKALGLVGEDGAYKEPSKDRANKSILYLMMDWENIPKKKETKDKKVTDATTPEKLKTELGGSAEPGDMPA
jgi:hypothetical protein